MEKFEAEIKIVKVMLEPVCNNGQYHLSEENLNNLLLGIFLSGKAEGLSEAMKRVKKLI